MKKLLIALTLFIIILGACKNKAQKSRFPDDSRSDRMEQQASEENQIPSIIIDEAYQREGNNKIKIRAVRMDGDILEIDVKYRSGCEEKITLHSTGMFKKSLPPQVDVFLQHNSTGECNDETETTLKFNISQLRYESENRVIVNVNSAEYKAEYQY